MLLKQNPPFLNPYWLGLSPWLSCPCTSWDSLLKTSHFSPVLDKFFSISKYILSTSKEMWKTNQSTKDCAFSKKWEHGAKFCALFFVLPWLTCCSDHVIGFLSNILEWQADGQIDCCACVYKCVFKGSWKTFLVIIIIPFHIRVLSIPDSILCRGKI